MLLIQYYSFWKFHPNSSYLDFVEEKFVLMSIHDVDMYYAVVDKWWYFDTSKWHTLEIRRTKKEEDLILIWYFLHRCSRTNVTVTTNQKESAKSTKKLFWLILFIRQKKRHHRICSSAWLHTIYTLGWNLVKNISIWENHNICINRLKS